MNSFLVVNGINLKSKRSDLFSCLNIRNKLKNWFRVPSGGSEALEPAHVCSFFGQTELNVGIAPDILDWNCRDRDHWVVFSCD